MLFESTSRLLLYLFIAYLLLVGCTYLLQRRMLYFPELQNLPPERVAALGLRHWPEAPPDYRGFVSARPLTHYRGTIVLFQGNAGAAWDRYFYPQALEPLGYRVVLAEYPGYGQRGGRPSEQSLVADARETVQRAHAEFGGPVYLWGESLGAAVAAAVAADPPVPVSAVVMLTPWDSLPALAQTLYRYLPARWLVRDRYDSIANLSGFSGRVAVLIAEQDEIIPRRHSMRLYEAITTRKRLWAFPGAGHNSWPAAPGALWWREVTDFISTQAP